MILGRAIAQLGIRINFCCNPYPPFFPEVKNGELEAQLGKVSNRVEPVALLGQGEKGHV